LARPREGLLAGRFTLYIGIVLLAALASGAYWLKTRSIFACQAPGYSADRYLAYCGGANYADFEHGAFISTSNLRRWTTPATPTCWSWATAACRWRCPTMRPRTGSSRRRPDITSWRSATTRTWFSPATFCGQ